MDKETRNRIQRATQAARALLEHEYAEQLEGVFDIRLDGTIAPAPGEHLNAPEQVLRAKLVTAVDHQIESGMKEVDAVAAYLREAAFTTLNRFIALKMLEARELVQACISQGDQSAGFKEFTGLVPGLVELSDHGYRVYIESLFDEIGREVRVLFDRRDPASLLWPRRQALLDLLAVLNEHELAAVWAEDETIGWVYQYFNGDDERRDMRAESQAPRDSRELAVRNQFFTPRYVVQFLTDNTLGRIWYEMRRGETELCDLDYLVRRPNEVYLAEGESPPPSNGSEQELTQAEWLSRPVHVTFRAKKDPRDIRVLDPACGSGHFLLYAFDLLLTIYAEAWDDQGAPGSEATGSALRNDYPSLDSLRTSVPGLILRYNLHGIDIDPRCVQITALALWLRAQRAFRDFGIPREERPPVARTNIAVSVPMPGHGEAREEFIATLSTGLAALTQRVFDHMEIAAEAGSLLPIREQIRTSIRETHSGGGPLFTASDEQAWQAAEAELLSALQNYTELAARDVQFNRRLFAEDAVDGFAFVDLCMKSYAVVLMNPPFGLSSSRAEAMHRRLYPNTWQDLYSCFMQRALQLTALEKGLVGVISPKSFYHAKKFRGLRDILRNGEGSLSLSVDLGGGVLDAAVEVCCSILGSAKSTERSLFVNAVSVEREERPRFLHEAMAALGKGRPISSLVAVDTVRDSSLPNSMYPYRFPPGLAKLFEKFEPFSPTYGRAAVGLTTFDNPRFMRAWWETPAAARASRDWIPVATGGGWAPFYGPQVMVLRWKDDAREMRANELTRYGTTARTTQSRGLWFKPGLTFSKISTLGFSTQPWVADGVFTGVGLFIDCADGEFWKWLAYFNSEPVGQILSLYSADRHWLSNSIGTLPCPGSLPPTLSELGKDAYQLASMSGRRRETSPDFSDPWSGPSAVDSESFRELLRRIDALVIRELGLDDNSISFLREHGTYKRSGLVVENVSLSSVLSYGLGGAFGRWSSTGLGKAEMPNPIETAFRPMPLRSPGMRGPHDPSAVGVFADDPGTDRDVAQCIVSFLTARARSFREGKIQDETNRTIDVDAVRHWLRSEAFDHHLANYGSGGRRAPIYWQLGVPSQGYSVWIYYQRLTSDTLYQVLNEHIAPKLEYEERKLTSMVRELGPDLSSKERKEIDLRDGFVAELRALHREVARVAPLWNPDLNDGAMINFAPLWRLVPQHRAWQKECKKVWDKLCKGDYDWAHLAMHLWPERVVPKCAKNRSLAIAHGLEDVFWEEGTDGKWSPRKVDSATIDTAIQERTSVAVKEALRSLLDAPAPAKPSSKLRGRRSTKRQQTRATRAKRDEA